MAQPVCPVDPKTREIWLAKAKSDSAGAGKSAPHPIEAPVAQQASEATAQTSGGFSWKNLIWSSAAAPGRPQTASTASGGSASTGVGTDSSGGSCPLGYDRPQIPTEEASACPVSPEARNAWIQAGRAQQKPLLAKTVTGVTEAVESCSSDTVGDLADDNSTVNLPDERQVSSIPRTGESSNWVYPSEKQFFKAMKRKQWDPEVDDMKTVVPLHNMVNEVAWRYILNWEQGQGGDECGGIKLTSFKGNAKQVTPRAFVGHYVFGRDLPFDRHDWTIDRCGKKVDYVIDFYSVPASADNPDPTFFLDVRPKLNSIEGWRLRIARAFK